MTGVRMSYAFYIILHVTGFVLAFTALGGMAVANAAGIDKASNPARKVLAITHGVGLLIAFVAGFGLMARIGIMHGSMWPVWLLAKFGIWIVVGAAPVVLNRVKGIGVPALILLPLLATGSAYFAKMKPGDNRGAAVVDVEPASEGAPAGEGSGE
jgi:hypothetical protein